MGPREHLTYRGTSANHAVGRDHAAVDRKARLEQLRAYDRITLLGGPNVSIDSDLDRAGHAELCTTSGPISEYVRARRRARLEAKTVRIAPRSSECSRKVDD